MTRAKLLEALIYVMMFAIWFVPIGSVWFYIYLATSVVVALLLIIGAWRRFGYLAGLIGGNLSVINYAASF